MNITAVETFPWVLSISLGEQIVGFTVEGNLNFMNAHEVFGVQVNSVNSLLNYPFLDKNPIVIEAWSFKRFMLPLAPIKREPFTPALPRIVSFTEAVTRSFELHTHSRYFLPHLLFRLVKRLLGDIEYWSVGSDVDYVYPSAVSADFRTFDEIDELVEGLAVRSRAFGAMGFTYLAVPIPEPDIFISEEINARRLNAEKYFIFKAQAKGVHVVSLLQSFIENGGWSLYQKNDGHWNGRGSSLAARVTARYIDDHALLLDKSEHIAPKAIEPLYEQEFRAFLRKHFRKDIPLSERSCVRPISSWFNR